MSEDKFKIDSHKLIYHPRRVADWLEGRLVYPLYMEISPSGACNHRCVFCSVDFMKYKKLFLATQVLKKCISDAGRNGLKSVMFAGEGEPLLHKDLPQIIRHTKEQGVDSAITTNGVLLKKSIFEQIHDSTEWIKVSCNAGTAETYAKIHGAGSKDYNKVIKNLSDAVKIREKNGSGCTLGIQIILLPETSSEIEVLAKTAKEIGLDYLVVKPYTFHPSNKHRFDITYDDFAYLDDVLKSYNSDSFHVVFRLETMKSWDRQARSYKRCHALPFWSYIDASGNVWGCSNHLLNDEFNYGNIYTEDFKTIWEGKKRWLNIKKLNENFDIKTCKLNCRMDKINQYLWDLKNLPEHVNFI